MLTGVGHSAPAVMTSRSAPSPTIESDVDAPPTYREPQWCPWLFASSPRLKAIVEEAIAQALNAEKFLKAFHRQRARRPDALGVFRRTVEALLCHVTHEYLRGAGAIRLTLANDVLRRSNRYLSELQGTQLPSTIKLLSTPELGFLVVVKGCKASAFVPGRQTTVAVGPRLISRLDGVSLNDIDRHPGEEVVLLKGLKERRESVADLIDYIDTETTDRYRAEMQSLNAFLKEADIQYVGDTALVDDGDRHLKRRFTRGSFSCGGRVWGGFWQNLRKADRLANILIDGENVVSLDFKSMIASLAYAHVGAAVPSKDLYDILFRTTSGISVTLPRTAVKKIFAARLNGAREWPEELRQYREGLPWKTVVASLKQAHALIADLMDSDLGQALAFTESEILMDVLTRLAREKIIALPIHDCVVVATSAKPVAEVVMLSAFFEHTKQHGSVSVEETYR